MFIGFEIYVIDDNSSKHPNLSLNDLFFYPFCLFVAPGYGINDQNYCKMMHPFYILGQLITSQDFHWSKITKHIPFGTFPESFGSIYRSWKIGLCPLYSASVNNKAQVKIKLISHQSWMVTLIIFYEKAAICIPNKVKVSQKSLENLLTDNNKSWKVVIRIRNDVYSSGSFRC